MASNRQHYELVNLQAEADSTNQEYDDDDDDNGQVATMAVSSVSEPYYPRTLQKGGIPAYKQIPPFKHRFGGKGWRVGLFIGFYASLIVHIINLSLLLLAAVAHGGIVDGIDTLLQGDSAYISLMGVALHVLMNIMSTVLLTSSNYAMQILCAPTRHEIDHAHTTGQWLEIGLVSLHNLRRIDMKRVILWWLLVVSSAPLQLL
ncbi:hypothetical protein N0V95_006602 [Ascochyta clinopodiicola]|nr:hypothetical protein N0V95_006602 [Ascochyta clinopodiicola]